MTVTYLWRMTSGKQWFEEWFDSPYYHTLYKHRDSTEAQSFLRKLIDWLPMRQGAKVLDIACGKGRHSIYLNSCGFDVFGFDLSPKSILHNLPFQNETLQFAVHDMRNVVRTAYFDYAFNLFSSFGYFDQYHDNQRVFTAAAAALKKGGTFVFDYVNAPWAIHHAMGSLTETNDGIQFNIKKYPEGEFILKDISFTDGGREYHYIERLRMFQPDQLCEMIRMAGLEITAVFGNYDLSPFDAEQSKRVIIVSMKK